MTYRIVPIRNEFLRKVRETGLDDQNQPVVSVIAKGGEPCRDVLRGAKEGEKLLLASYCPFDKSGPYREYGAVFVLAKQSDEVVDYVYFPIQEGEQSAYFGDCFVLRAYDSDESIYDARLVMQINYSETIREMFSSPEVQFIHARFAAYGCYALRLERT